MLLKLRQMLMDQAGGEGEGSSGGGGVTDDKNAGGKGGAGGEGAAGEGAAGEGEGAKGVWPDNWAELMSGGDDKLLKRFGRYASPVEVGKGLVSAQNRISSGELKPVLAKDAGPEEVAAWRKEMGIPEKPDGYDLKFDSGLVIGKEDKPMIDGFLAAGHELNYTPDQARGAIEWYYAEQERQTEARVAKDDEERIACLDELNEEWGGNFRTEMNRVTGLLQMFPEEIRPLLAGARLADGSGVFNNPQVVRTFAMLSHELYPGNTVVPHGEDGAHAKNIEARLKEISEFRAKHRAAYNKDEAMQKEERDLLEAQAKVKAREAA